MDVPITDAALVTLLESRRADRLNGQTWGYPPRNPIASDLPDCRRYQVVRMIAWQVRQTPDLKGRAVIENGNVQEPAMIRQLQDEGWTIVQQQAPFQILQPVPRPDGPRKVVISGKLDGKIKLDGELIPFDTKDTGEHVVERIDTEEDLLASPWTRKWRRQLMIYCVGENHERGLLIVGFRGERKFISVRIDYAEVEELIERCAWAVGLAEELVAADIDHEKLDTALGERGVPYHHAFEECRRCPFHQRACFPPEPAVRQAQIRPDLLATVEQYIAGRPFASAAEKLRKTIKEATEGFPQTIVGEYVIDGEVKTRRMKAQPERGAHTQESWGFEVRRVGEKGKI